MCVCLFYALLSYKNGFGRIRFFRYISSSLHILTACLCNLILTTCTIVSMINHTIPSVRLFSMQLFSDGKCFRLFVYKEDREKSASWPAFFCDCLLILERQHISCSTWKYSLVLWWTTVITARFKLFWITNVLQYCFDMRIYYLIRTSQICITTICLFATITKV